VKTEKVEEETPFLFVFYWWVSIFSFHF